MILLTGATGLTGREIARGLAAAGAPCRALVRDPEKAAPLRESGIETVRGDLADPASIRAALDGVDRAFLLSAFSPDQVELHGNFIEAAREAGVGHVVRMSTLGANPKAKAPGPKWHGQSEKQLEESGVPYTHLRPHWFMQNFLASAETIRAEGAILAPMGEGRIGAVDARDIAAVAVRTLVEDGHQGKRYLITGPESLTHEEIAETFSRVLGKEVRYVETTPEDTREALSGAGLPDWMVDALLGFYAVFKAGLGDKVTDVVERVGSKEPIRMEQFVRDHAAAFGG